MLIMLKLANILFWFSDRFDDLGAALIRRWRRARFYEDEEVED